MQTKSLTNNVQTLFVGLSLVPLTGLELPKRIFVLFCKFEKMPILRGFTAIYSNEVILSLHNFSQQ